MSVQILIIEDEGMLSGPVARELESKFGYHVTTARDPIEMQGILSTKKFDVAFVDLLYRDLMQEFRRKVQTGQISLTGRQLLVTGLTALRILRERDASTKLAVWTSGEGSRSLQMSFAYSLLGVKTIAAKSGPTGQVDPLREAIQSAMEDREFVEETLEPYLPDPGAPTLYDTFLANETHRAIWRACALGASTAKSIADIVGVSHKQMSKYIGEMCRKLLDYTALPPRDRDSQNTVVRYAEGHWEFFLDDAVRTLYP